MQPLFLCCYASEKGAKKGFRAQMLYLLLYPKIAVLNYLHNTQVNENQSYFTNQQSQQEWAITADAPIYSQPRHKIRCPRTFCRPLLLGQRG